MPLILGRDKHLPNLGGRLSLKQSNIPKPTKQLVLSNRQTGINHASKPSSDIIPVTPLKKPPSFVSQQKHVDRSNISQRLPQANKNNNPPEIDPTIVILELIPFGGQPIVNFGEVKVNQTQIKYVALRNSQDIQQKLFVRSFPKPDKGINMDATEFLLAPQTETYITLAWTPKIVGSFRDSITFQDVHRMPKKIILMGKALCEKSPIKPPSRFVSRFAHKTSMAAKISPIKFRVHKAPARPESRRKENQNPRNEPLNRLIFAYKRRQSAQIVRRLLSQRDESMAIKVQSIWRMLLAKQQLRKIRAAITIQSFWRMASAKRQYQRTTAVVKVQSIWRMLLAKHKLRKMTRAATTIQSFWRMASAKRQYQRTIAVVKVQSIWRMLLAKHKLRKMTRATIIIQSFWRMISAKRHYRRTKAAIKIQSIWRMLLAKQQLCKMTRAAITIQSFWRMASEKRQYQRTLTAIRIQSFWRMLLAKQKLRKIRAAITIQSLWRMVAARRQFQRTTAAIKIQSIWRMLLAKQQLRKMTRAAITIQSFWRMASAKRQYQSTRAVVKIQSNWRMLIAKRQYLRNKTAIRIQSIWRMVIAQQHLRRVIYIQSLARGFIVRNRLRRSIEALNRCMNDCNSVQC